MSKIILEKYKISIVFTKKMLDRLWVQYKEFLRLYNVIDK